MNRCALPIPGEGKLRSIFHLDQRPITKADERMCIFRRTNTLTLFQLLASINRQATSIIDLINLAFGGLHCSFKLATKRRIALDEGKRE